MYCIITLHIVPNYISLFTLPHLRTGITLLDQPDTNHVAVLIGDDRGGAPLLLYVGEKRPGGFLERNGLSFGYLHVWVADDGTDNADEFIGTGESKTGRFVKIEHYQPENAGLPGFDDLGFADQATQDDLSYNVAGAFRFSRPEDVSTNPGDGSQAVLHSTGRASLFPNEKWGQTLLIEVDFTSFVPGEDVPADVTIMYEGNESEDFGIRSPDNGAWADDGLIYGT